VPRRQRSQLIAEAVEQNLDRLKQERAVEAVAGIWDSPKRSEPEDEVRAPRTSWDDRLDRLDRLEDGGG